MKVFEHKTAKVTVEQISEFEFITTFWDKETDLEADREVYEYETYGGALDEAFDIMSQLIKEGI